MKSDLKASTLVMVKLSEKKKHTHSFCKYAVSRLAGYESRVRPAPDSSLLLYGKDKKKY